MTHNLKERMLNSVRNDMLYDFVANNYSSMSKQEIKDIALEAIYAFYEAIETAYDPKKLKADLTNELEDRIYDDDDE